MKKILLISGLILLFSLLLAPVILAQDNGPGLPDTAVGGVNWLLGHIDATTAWFLGLASMVVSSVVNKYFSDRKTGEAIMSSVRFAVAAIVPAGLTWFYNAFLLPVAEQLDANGWWAVFLAVFGMATVNYLAKTRLLDPAMGVLDGWKYSLTHRLTLGK